MDSQVCMRCGEAGRPLCESCQQQIDRCILCTAPLVGPHRGTLLCGECHEDAATPPTTIPLMLAVLRGEKRLGSEVHIFLGDLGWVQIPRSAEIRETRAPMGTIHERVQAQYPGHVWDERFGIIQADDPRATM